MTGEQILGLLIIACAPFIFYKAIKKGTAKGEQIKYARDNARPRDLYDMDMRIYNKNKTTGILFLFLFFPIGLIILLANTKPDASSYKDWDNTSEKYQSNINNPVSSYADIEFSKPLESNQLSEREQKLLNELTQNDKPNDIKVKEELVLSEREKEIIKQLRNTEG
jgi:hypothetical protein